jgi:hypothetical protein
MARRNKFIPSGRETNQRERTKGQAPTLVRFLPVETTRTVIQAEMKTVVIFVSHRCGYRRSHHVDKAKHVDGAHGKQTKGHQGKHE